MSKWKISHKLNQLHMVRQYAQKYMVKWSEFKMAADYIQKSIPGCAGFILGLPPVCQKSPPCFWLNKDNDNRTN
jgi:hypothetical protein